MGAGGAYEVSHVTKRMAQLAGRDFKRNNPVRDEDRWHWLHDYSMRGSATYAIGVALLQKTDKFKMHKFHHIEYWCPDATNACKR